MSFYEESSIVITPNAYKAGTLYAINPASGLADMDVTRATAATRVDESGLVNYAEILGGEEVTNGGFSAAGINLVDNPNFTDLPLGDGWSIQEPTGQTVEFNGTQVHINYDSSATQGSTGINQATLDADKSYKIVLDIASLTGDAGNKLRVQAGGVVTDFSDAGIKTFYVKTVSGPLYIVRASNGTSFETYINSISVQELGEGWSTTETWSFNDDYATASGNSNSQYLQQDFTTVNGKTYKFNYEILENTLNGNGSGLSSSGAFGSVSISSDIGTHTAYIVALDSSLPAIKIGVSATVTTGTIKITNISVEESTRDNIARIDYTGGGCPHILAEPQRDNLIPYSEDFTEWSSKTNIDVTLNSATSPDGVVNATFINENNSNAQHFVGQSLSITNGQDISISVYAKKNQRDVLQISPSGNYLSTSGYANYDLSNGLVTASGGGVTAEIEGLTNGWFRCVAKFTANNTASGTAAFFLQNSTTASRGSSYDGDGTSGIYIWGAQIEVGSYPTSYIPTSGATVTRNQDQFSRDGISSLINSTEGCVFGEGNFAESNSSSYNYFVSLSDGTSSNRLEVRQSSPNLQFLWRVATYQSEISTSSLDVSSNFKFALNYSAANIKFYVNGDLIGTINTPTLWSVNTLNRLAFDDGTGGNRLSGKVKQLQVYPTALTDEQLIELTGVTYSSYLAMANALNYTIQ